MILNDDEVPGTYAVAVGIYSVENMFRNQSWAVFSSRLYFLLGLGFTSTTISEIMSTVDLNQEWVDSLEGPGLSLFVVSIVGGVVSLIVVGLRCFIRSRKGIFALDDGLMLGGLVSEQLEQRQLGESAPDSRHSCSLTVVRHCRYSTLPTSFSPALELGGAWAHAMLLSTLSC